MTTFGIAKTARTAAVLISAAALASAGCAPEDIDRAYGKRRGPQGGLSVNGTAVLADMFADAGYRVRTWRRLSPKLEESQVIVWAPDEFQPPTREHREFLEKWLWREDNRTLVYIGRDYDAAITYWRRVRPEAPPEQALEVARRLATVQSEFDAARAALPNDEPCDWFTLRSQGDRRVVQSLEGPWAEDIDAAQVEIEIAARLNVPSESEIDSWSQQNEYPWIQPPRFERLLTSRDDELVTRITFANGSRILVVTNGSFLLNLPLVNHEHRKLAGKLIEACAPPGRVVFLESGPGGPLVLEQEPDAAYPTGLEIFTVWPLGIIVLHLAALGILACIALFPIHGRPRESARSSPADFGKHVVALGELLELTRERRYAVDRVRYYYEHVRRESGRSHRVEKTGPPPPGGKQPEPVTPNVDRGDDE